MVMLGPQWGRTGTPGLGEGLSLDSLFPLRPLDSELRKLWGGFTFPFVTAQRFHGSFMYILLI